MLTSGPLTSGFLTTFEKLIPREALAAVGLDLNRVVKDTPLRQSHGHVCAYVSMVGVGAVQAVKTRFLTHEARKASSFK